MGGNADLDEFFRGGPWAVVGVSRYPNKYGSIVHRRLKRRGEVVYPVNPELAEVEGERCYPNLFELPEPVEQIVVVLPPKGTEKVVNEAVEAGIRRVWLQPGAESSEAVEYGRSRGLTVVHGRCILRHMDALDMKGSIPR